MTHRLVRIESLILSLTTLGAVCALATTTLRPLGVVLGGGAGLLDFVLIRLLVATALGRHPRATWAVPLAFTKSLVLVAVPASVLLIPDTLVDGVSFALGVATLPVAIVVDALWPLPSSRGEGVH